MNKTNEICLEHCSQASGGGLKGDKRPLWPMSAASGSAGGRSYGETHGLLKENLSASRLGSLAEVQ